MRLIENNDFDIEYLINLRSYPDIWMNLGNIKMLNRHIEEKWFKKIIEDDSQNYYIIYDIKNKCNIGLLRTDQIDFINRSVRVGCDIHPSFHSKGYGFKSICMIIKYFFDYYNMNRIWLMVIETNTKALNLYKKVGFVEEGRQRNAIYRNGIYNDYIMMGILRNDNSYKYIK